MLACLTELLHCPSCRSGAPLTLADDEREGEQILSGKLLCGECGKSYPVQNGVADFLDGPSSPPHLSQRLMEARPVVWIYEKYWRPALVQRVQKGFSFEKESGLVTDFFGLRRGDVVADLACGPGNYSRRWAGSVSKEKDTSRAPKVPEGLVVGVDISRPMLESATAKAKAQGYANLSFIRADVHRLPLAPEAFGGVSCLAALHLFKEPGEVIRQVGQALQRGRRFVCLTVETDEKSPVRRFLQQRSELLTGLHFFDGDELPRYCERAGLSWAASHREGPILIFAGERVL